RLEQMQERGVTDSGPDADWKAIPAFFGFPVEAGTEALTCRPWLTWGLSLIIALVSLSAFFDLKSAVESFGFVPAEPWRRGGGGKKAQPNPRKFPESGNSTPPVGEDL